MKPKTAYTHALLTLVLLQPLSAERRDAHEWLQEQIDELLAKGQTWSSGRVWGDLHIPPEGLIVTRPLELPLRSVLVGPHEYFEAARTPGNLWVDPQQFPHGEFAVTWEESRSRGGFGQGVRNVVIDCNGVANGIWLNGDQESHYSGLRIDQPHSLGVLMTTSHGTTLVNLSVDGGHQRSRRRQLVGLQIGLPNRMATSSIVMGSSFNWCGIGIFRNNAHTTDDYASSFENTPLPYYTYQSRSCFSRGHLMLSGNRLGSIALIEESSHLQMSGTIRQSSSSNAYVVDDGQTTLVSSRADRNSPQPWVFVHTAVQGLDLPVDELDPAVPRGRGEPVQ